MNLGQYRERRSSLSDSEIEKHLRIKEDELESVVRASGIRFRQPMIRVAVLGCADRRSIAGHRDIFRRVLGGPVDLVTFDITVEHLASGEGVVQHDCTVPLPDAPYDLAYGHILLKFMPPDKQWQVLLRSYEALRSGGVALHFMHESGHSQPSDMLPDGFYQVPLREFEEALTAEGVEFHELSLKVGFGDGTCLMLFRR
jgi:hypothetical protein